MPIFGTDLFGTDLFGDLNIGEDTSSPEASALDRKKEVCECHDYRLAVICSQEVNCDHDYHIDGHV